MRLGMIESQDKTSVTIRRFVMRSSQVTTAKRHEIELQQRRFELKNEAQRLEKLRATLRLKLQLAGHYFSKVHPAA
jgi:hypothetical protein